jgi:O-antigen/teichoic acid export membrane protein
MTRTTGFFGAGLRDALLVLPGRIFPAGGILLIAVLGSRTLDPHDLGRLGIYLALAQVGSVIASGWLDQATLRFLPAQMVRGEGEQFVSRAMRSMRFVLVVSLSFFLLIGAVKSLFNLPFGLEDLVLSGILILLTAMFNGSQFVLLGKGLAKHYTLAEVWRFLALASGLGLSVALDLRGAEIWALVVAISLLLAWLYSANTAGIVRPLFGERGASIDKAILTYGLPLVGWLGATQLLVVMDRFLLYYFLDGEAVGIFFANSQFLPAASLLAASPVLYAAHAHIMAATEKVSQAEVGKLIKKFGGLFVAFSVPLALVLSTAASPVTNRFLGEEFRGGVSIVPVLIVANLVWVAGMFLHKPLEIRRQTGKMLVAILMSLGVKFLASVLLIPPWGLMGAAGGTLLAFSAYAAMVAVMGRSFYRGAR